MNQSPVIENRFPRHTIISRGIVSQPNKKDYTDYTPKNIDYRHTVRVISSFDCGHLNIIKNLKQQNELKSKQIQDLKKIIQIKNQEIQQKKRQIDALNQRQKQMKQMKNKEKKEIEITHARRLSDQHISFIESNIVLIRETFQEQEDKDTQNLNKIKKEIKNTQDILNDLSRVIEKPKKTYQFYNKHLDPNNSKISPLNFNKKQKLDRTTCRDNQSRTSIQSDRLMSTSRSLQTQNTIFDRQSQKIITNFQNISLDITNTDQSKDTTYFLQQAIKQHKHLQQSLIQLQNKTKTQIQQLRQSYQQKIRTYVDLLERQKQKNQRIYIQSSQYNKFIVNRQQLFCLEDLDHGQLYQNNSFFDDLAQDSILIDTL